MLELLNQLGGHVKAYRLVGCPPTHLTGVNRLVTGIITMTMIYRHWFPCTVTPEIPHGKGYTGYTYRTVEKRDKARFAPSAAKDSVSLKHAITKYGKENMQTDIIESDILPIPDLVNEREIYWIAYFDDFRNGYNQTIGGDGMGSGENHPFFGKKRPDISGENHPFFGKKRPDISEKMSGERNPMFGRSGENSPAFSRSGENSPNFGKKRPEMSGEKHPCTRPEYMQGRVFFFLCIAPMDIDISEKRQQLYKAFERIPQRTLRRWFRKWQKELENSN